MKPTKPITPHIKVGERVTLTPDGVERHPVEIVFVPIEPVSKGNPFESATFNDADVDCGDPSTD